MKQSNTILLLLAGLALLSSANPARASQSVVISIGDGDTITVKEQGVKVRVRLACIDAPETAQKPYGLQARETLKQLTPVGQTVTLRTVAVDRYSRTVAEIFVGSKNVNLALVRQGNAFAYRDYLQNCNRELYLGAEREAEAKRLGVWQVPGGVQRPWDWRHGTRPGGSSSRANTAAPTQGRYKCAQIGSWAKAQELLKQGHTYLDRDGDGVACESLR